jgi:hypothetical protein
VNVSTGFCVPSFIVRLAAGKAHWAKQAETSLLPTWRKARRRRVSTKGHDREFAAACIFVIVGALAQTAEAAQAPNTTNALKRIDDRTFEVMGKVDGKPALTTRVAVAADGKTMTATQTGTNAQGQSVNNVVLLNKQ